MNNTEQYIHNIWTIMPMHTDKEKFYLLDLKKHLKEFMDDHPDCSYESKNAVHRRSIWRSPI